MDQESRPILLQENIKPTFPPEFLHVYVRGRYSDLSAMSDDDLVAHYKAFGRREGRAASPAVFRHEFLKILEGARSVLEIGPFAAPIMQGTNVTYVDLMSTEEVRAKTIERGGDPSTVPHIHFTDGLEDVTGSYSAVVSSHNIEHHPDLISHLQTVENLIEADGVYALIIPDKRFCFDHPFAESNVAEIIEAYVLKRKRHALRHVLEHHALTAHNDSVAHWAGEHGTADTKAQVAGLKAAWKAYEERPDEYIDVHAWQFTPNSFRNVIQTLNALGLTRFRPLRVYDTPVERVEFCAVLEIGSNSEAIEG